MNPEPLLFFNSHGFPAFRFEVIIFPATPGFRTLPPGFDQSFSLEAVKYGI